MHPTSRWLPPGLGAYLPLALLFLLIPLFSRHALGWDDGFGYASDLGIGLLLSLLLYNQPRPLALPFLLLWGVLHLGNAELVAAVGRMPETGDLQYLTDAQFVGNSTHGGGLGHPWLALSLALATLACLLCGGYRSERRRLPLWLYLLPLLILGGHSVGQYRLTSDAAQWQQFNLPHKLLAEGLSSLQQEFDLWLEGPEPGQAADISALTRQDLNGRSLLDGSGQARNVLIITLEGIPGAYIAANRAALGSSYPLDPMPRLSAWAARAMTTPDYVLHSHQTIRGLYAMLCGDYSKLDSGTPKGLELLNNPQRAADCLPAQLRQHGFSTHFLQGAGLRFMAKDKVMPQMGFEKTLGRDWFRNQAYLEFPWGMDDKAFFEGALGYVKQLKRQKQPWMLTLLTVGTHQPYSAPAEYLTRYPEPKQAAIAYLDDAIDAFLSALERQGVLKDTLVIVTSDESHGIENLRLASAWGFNLVLAPEQERLPAVKAGVYGHVDLTASILDYLALPLPPAISGRSLFRDYAHGRAIMSYTNGMLRQHDGHGVFTECNFRQVCRRYRSEGFIADQAEYSGRSSGRQARLQVAQASLLDQSLLGGLQGQQYQFATRERIKLKEQIGDDWADNLIGAQYLELPKGSHTTVKLKIRALRTDERGARILLKTKEFDRDVPVPIPELPLLRSDQPLEVSFGFDNRETRKAFSFHLLAQGRGAIEITDFRVDTQTDLSQ